MFFHVFIFDVYEVELIHQNEIKNQTIQRYKNQNRKIIPNSFSWTGATYVNGTEFCHEIGLSDR